MHAAKLLLVLITLSCIVILINVMFNEEMVPIFHTQVAPKFFKQPLNHSIIEDMDISVVNENVTQALSSVDTSLSESSSSSTPILTPLQNGFLRAVVVYLPYDPAKRALIAQMRWLRRSWIEMSKYEKQNWNTDIVVITEKGLPFLYELECTTNVRKFRNESNRCIIVEGYVSVKQRYEEFKGYDFADSIGALSWSTDALDVYDWILRTDIDTFLTPAFASWRPEKMVIGQGAYCFNGYITCHRLKRIAKDMNLTDAGVENVGSTWFGPTKIVQSCANLSIEAMRYIHQWEFSKLEYGDKAPFNWPEWHHGVLTMYGGQIAINHCTKDIGFEKRPDLLDVETTRSSSVNDHPHLHSWQNNEKFSKFVFMDQGYTNEALEELDLNKISEYALYMALDAHQNITIGT